MTALLSDKELRSASNFGDLIQRVGKSRLTGLHPLGFMQLNCDKHGVFVAKGTRMTSRDVWSMCPACQAEIDQRATDAKAEIARRIARDDHARALATVGVPARFVGRTLASFKAETPEQQRALSVASDFVANWAEMRRKGSWLVFSGQPGTGKSHLAIAILQAMLPANVGRYMTCLELIQTIRSAWRKDSELSEMDVVAELASVPLLVLDEIGVQNGTDSEMLHLFDVLDKRYRDLMPTILLTNQNKDGFRQFVGERVYDRMTECARWVPCVWPSYRPQARKEMADA